MALPYYRDGALLQQIADIAEVCGVCTQASATA
jgi:hypothetical protein